MKKIIMISIMLFATQFIIAGNNTGYTKIKRIYTYDKGAVIITFNSSKNEDECSSDDSDSYFVIRFDEVGGKEKFSAALTAYISQQNIRLGYSGCDDIWGASKTLPYVYRVDMSQ